MKCFVQPQVKVNESTTSGPTKPQSLRRHLLRLIMHKKCTAAHLYIGYMFSQCIIPYSQCALHSICGMRLCGALQRALSDIFDHNLNDQLAKRTAIDDAERSGTNENRNAYPLPANMHIQMFICIYWVTGLPALSHSSCRFSSCRNFFGAPMK